MTTATGGADPPAMAESARLASADLHVVGAFANASNTTLLVQLVDEGHDPLDLADLADGSAPGVVVDPASLIDAVDLAVYKPVRGQRMLWDFDATTLPGREVATRIVDARLGFDLVPPTVWRDEGPLGPGSAQAYVDHDPEAHWFTWIEDDDRLDLDAAARLVVLDLVVNNTDRKAGHVLVTDDGIAAIDHGVTFHVEDKLRTVCWELQGEPVPDDLRDACRSLASWLDGHPPELLVHLTVAEVQAARDRAASTAQLEVFPNLVHRGQLPWPLV